MSPFEIGLISVVAMVAMIYLGVYIPIALGLVSFVHDLDPAGQL